MQNLLRDFLIKRYGSNLLAVGGGARGAVILLRHLTQVKMRKDEQVG